MLISSAAERFSFVVVFFFFFFRENKAWHFMWLGISHEISVLFSLKNNNNNNNDNNNKISKCHLLQ